MLISNFATTTIIKYLVWFSLEYKLHLPYINPFISGNFKTQKTP